MNRRILGVAAALAALLAVPGTSLAAVGDAKPGCADIVGGDLIYTSEPGTPTVFAFADTAAPDCKQVRYTLTIFPGDENGATSTVALATSVVRGDGQATDTGGGTVDWAVPITSGDTWVCVTFESMKGKHVADGPDDGSCIPVLLDGGSPGRGGTIG